MTRFSANLGLLWNDRPLTEAIRAAGSAGFDAVECHWPYAHDAADVKAALDETGLQMLGLNTSPGDRTAGEYGLSAVPGREDDARAAIDQALAYADAVDANNIHVMAGMASGDDAKSAFISNLKYAATLAAEANRIILIEPLNHHDAPGYFLTHTDQARAIIKAVGADNLKLMFDCYHVQIMEGDLTRRIDANMDIIGHIQFASVPDRGAPDEGEINFKHIFAHLAASGYDASIGAEYKPKNGDTDASLGWMMTAANPSSGQN